MKIKTDVSKNYFNAIQALKDKGFEHVGRIYYGHAQRALLFEKSGKKYYFGGMNHFNTTIYTVTLYNVNSLKSEYSIEYDVY